MPIIKSAIKRMRQEYKKRARNKTAKRVLKNAINVAIKTKTVKDMSSAFSVIDKTAKKNIIHKNKAARLKSKLSKITPRSITKKTSKSKKSAKKTA